MRTNKLDLEKISDFTKKYLSVFSTDRCEEAIAALYCSFLLIYIINNVEREEGLGLAMNCYKYIPYLLSINNYEKETLLHDRKRYN